MKKIFFNLRKLLKQPVTYKLKVIRIFGLDLEKYYNSLHYFFDEVFWDNNADEYFFIKKKIVYICTGKTEKIIEVSFQIEDTNIEEIIEDLKKIGIYTELFE